MPERTLRSLARVVDDPDFTPDAVGKQSKAAMSMCLWVKAMYTYGQIALVVAPKRARLADAEFSLEAMNAELRGKRAQLQVRHTPVTAAHASAYGRLPHYPHWLVVFGQSWL